MFEVEEDAGEEDPGRIIISMEYEMDSKNKESYGSTENRVAAQVHIQHDNVFTIVPVIKVSDLLNRFLLDPHILQIDLNILTLNKLLISEG